MNFHTYMHFHTSKYTQKESERAKPKIVLSVDSHVRAYYVEIGNTEMCTHNIEMCIETYVQKSICSRIIVIT